MCIRENLLEGIFIYYSDAFKAGAAHSSFKDEELPPEIRQHFPFPSFRRGQAQVLALIAAYPRIAINAYTGFGKSVTAFSAFWDLMKTGEYQLWCFSKTKAQLRSVFLKTLKEYYSNPPADKLTLLPLIASKDLCPLPPENDCFHCPRKKKTRFLPLSSLREILPQISLQHCPSSFAGFQELLTPYGCPAQVIRRLLPQANIILLPQGYLESHSLQRSLSRFTWKAHDYGFRWSHRFAIIDEAHNFGPTIEATVTRKQLSLVESIGAFPVVQILQNLCQRKYGYVKRPPTLDRSYLAQIDSFLHQKGIRYSLSPLDLEALLAVRSFVERQGRYWVNTEEGLVQLDPYPSKIFEYVNRQFSRTVLFSATFQYLKYYSHYYGLKKKPWNMYHLHHVPTPKSRIQQLLVAAFIHPQVSSSHRNRTKKFLRWCAKTVKEVALEIPDHTWVFVPSYEFLDDLFPLLEEHLNEKLSLYREPRKGQITFLSELMNGDPSVVLAVYGGKFSEGVEVRDPQTGRSRVRMVILIGLPFPAPTPVYNLLYRLYFNRYRHLHFVKWTLIERYLFTQVRQCLGRAIRSEVDQATGLILDNRAMFNQHHLPNLQLFRSFRNLRAVLRNRFQSF